MVNWIKEAWKSISQEQILASMKQCGVTNSLDGSEDTVIEYFKNNLNAKAIFEKPTNLDLSEERSLDEENTVYIIDDDSDWCESDESN